MTDMEPGVASGGGGMEEHDDFMDGGLVQRRKASDRHLLQVPAPRPAQWDGRGPKPELAVQDLSKLDPSKLTPLTPEVISRQATINIGTIGHVAHGKSTIVKALSGVRTVRFRSELARNITIKLGYANAKIYRSSAEPYVYSSGGSACADSYPMEDGSGRTMELVRHVSFVDCPGHDILMATMLNGAAVMDAALLLIAANEPCPQPQTLEHLAAIEIMQLDKVIIIQNKIDIVKEDEALEQKKDIEAFVKDTVAGSAPLLPVAAQLEFNTDLVAEYIARKVPVPIRDFTSSPRLIVIRSFDVNKPGFTVDDIIGGVAGGSILRGVLRIGDEIEVRPGIVTRDADTGAITCLPIHSQILSLQAEANNLQFAVPGGLIGVGTSIDPTLTRADRLVGQVLGHRDSLPDIYGEVEAEFHLLRRLLGVKSSGKKQQKVAKLTKGEGLMVNIGSTSTMGRVVSVSGDRASIELTQPVCITPGEKIALSRMISKHYR